MHPLEKMAISIRRSPLLRKADSFWSVVRPVYVRFLSWLGRDGVVRQINGMDAIRILPRLYTLAEEYEPEVWDLIMNDVKQGDTVADVGAHIGLYTVALAKRVEANGTVVAFEPDAENFEMLQHHVKLNHIGHIVTLKQAAVGARDGTVRLTTGRSSENRISMSSDEPGQNVLLTRLDTFLENKRLDLLKIDVEGFEEDVLKGAQQLLRDPERKPRAIYIEVHPFNWRLVGTTSESLLALLQSCEYQVFDLTGNTVDRITQYGEVVARQLKPREGARS
jgi:FkbM family methyltransferase